MGKGDKKAKVVREEEEEEEENEEEEEEEEEEGDEEEEGLLLNMADLPRPVRNRVLAMKKLQDDTDNVDQEYKQERMALERKYIERRQALYENRRQIIAGEVEVPDVPLEEGEEEPAAAAEDAEPPKGVPEFWTTVLSVHPAINEYITEDDLPVLSKLTDISCNHAEDFTSFTLTFQFAENDYFSNATLTKKYEVMPDLLDDQSPTLKSTEGCEIQWKAGKNLCEEEFTKKQRAKSGRNKGQVRTITIKKPKRSFFHFFSPMTNQVAAEEDNDDEEGEAKPDEPVDKDGNPVKIDPESDYDIGHVIRTSLIPQAINWFTGEAALEYDAMFGYDDEEDEDDEDDEEDDEEEDDEEEEEEAPPKGKKSQPKGGFAPPKKGGKPGAGGEEKPAECKQN